MFNPTCVYTCRCGHVYHLRIFALEAPPIPYHAWPSDSWLGYGGDPECERSQGDECFTRDCYLLLPTLNPRGFYR